MPLTLTRFITVRSKVSTSDALDGLILASTAAREIADLLQFPPAQAAASVLLLIFQTVKNVQTNKRDCQRLARRCLSLLVAIRDQVADHHEIPLSLSKAISKFEQTLEDIYQFMKQAADQKWGARLMRKGSIESALSDYNAALDDAARGFQIATLINIHLSVGDSTSSKKEGPGLTIDTRHIESREAPGSTLPPYSSMSEATGVVITDVEELSTSPVTRSATISSFDMIELPARDSGRSSGSKSQLDVSFDLIDFSSVNSSSFISRPTGEMVVEEAEEEEASVTEHHGFNRYHQSQFRMKGKSRTINEGWWSGAIEGELGGQKSLMLRYDGDRKKAMNRWVRDVKLLQNVYHPNLPQMVGYSNDETPTPFILLANVQTRLPQAMLLDALQRASLARCAQLLLQFFRDTLDAALYVQQQLSLSDSKVQDYVENASLRIDAEKTVIMGLPPPEIDNVVSWRNYGLAHSIRDIFLKTLPNRGLSTKGPVSSDDQNTTAEMQRKLNHLTILARALLPSSSSLPIVQQRLRTLLGHDMESEGGFSEMPLVTLRQIRKAAIAADTHQQAWFENSGITPHQFSVGDLGYLPGGNTTEKDWSKFVVLCNVLDDELAKLDIKKETKGTQGGWQSGFHRWDDMGSFELPGDVHGWTVVVPPEAEFSIHIVHTNEVARVHDAWNYLLDVGKVMGETHGIKPEELILITRVGTEQRFKVRDLRRIRYWPAPAHMGHMPGGTHGFQHGGFQHGRGHFPGQFGHANFGHQPFGGNGPGGPQRLIPGQDLAPTVFYLFTSGAKEHEPYFSQTPMHMPPMKGAKPSELDPNVIKCFALLDIMYGFMNYVQLHAEDFID